MSIVDIVPIEELKPAHKKVLAARRKQLKVQIIELTDTINRLEDEIDDIDEHMHTIAKINKWYKGLPLEVREYKQLRSVTIKLAQAVAGARRTVFINNSNYQVDGTYSMIGDKETTVCIGEYRSRKQAEKAALDWLVQDGPEAQSEAKSKKHSKRKK